MHRGYIKYWRKIKDWSWFKDSKTKSLFLHLVSEANHKKMTFMGHDIDRGQVVCGLFKLEEDLGISVQSLRTSFSKLKSTNDITTKSTNKFTIVTIVNYEDYQSDVTTKSTRKPTNHQQTTNKPLTTIEECKELKNEKKKDISPFFYEFWKLYPNGLSFTKTLAAFQKLEITQELWAEMKMAIEEQKQSKQWKDGYIPASFNWIEEERWKDRMAKSQSDRKAQLLERLKV